MKKRFQQAEKDIGHLKTEIQRQGNRESEALERISEAAKATQELSRELEKVLVVGDEAKARKVQSEIDKLQTKVIALDSSLVAGLEKELIALNKQLAEVRTEKDRVFSKLAAQWLQAEAGRYDSVARETIQHLRRLLCVHNFLRDVGYGETYANTLGSGSHYLPHVKLPVLKDFNVTNFQDKAGLHSGREASDKIFNEIVK